MMTETDDILAFWFDEVGPDRWWVKSEETDAAIQARFADLREEWRARTADSFLGSAREALAGVILFDQFSRNLFRDSAEAFATDTLALAIAKGAIENGLDETMTDDERSFLYMPFQHSEDLDDQQRSLLLFTSLGIQNAIDFAKKHHDIIEKFGRFPHRNAALGRADRPGEEAAIEEGKGW
jgi:uncharacterized protein (DUF924 family)